MSHEHQVTAGAPQLPLGHEDTDKGAAEQSVSGAAAGVSRTVVRILAGSTRQSVAGTVAGLLEETAGYPLDTVKTRMQTSTHSVSAIEVLRTTIKNEGFFGLFKGLSTPLVSVAVSNAILFGAFDKAMEVQHDLTSALKVGAHTKGDILRERVIAGMCAGFATSLVVCPIELVKTKLQLQDYRNPTYTGPINCIRKVAATDGLRGLFKGYSATVLRDVPSSGLYFALYYSLKEKLATTIDSGAPAATETSAGHDGHHPANPIAVAAAGAVAGMVMTCMQHPFDVIKSKMQAGSDVVIGHGPPPAAASAAATATAAATEAAATATHAPPPPPPVAPAAAAAEGAAAAAHPTPAADYRTLRSTVASTYARSGFSGFLRGIVPNVIRAAPAHAVGFLAFELTLKLLPDELAIEFFEDVKKKVF